MRLLFNIFCRVDRDGKVQEPYESQPKQEGSQEWNSQSQETALHLSQGSRPQVPQKQKESIQKDARSEKSRKVNLKRTETE